MVAGSNTSLYWQIPGWVAEWFKAPALTKSAAADLGRERSERSERSEDGKHALSMFSAKLAGRANFLYLAGPDGWPSGLRLQS